MPQCVHFITTELQCSLEQIEGQERCEKHHQKHLQREADAGPVRQGGCSAILVNGKRCKSFADDGKIICTRHARVAEAARRRREEKAEEDVVIAQRVEVFARDEIPWRLAMQLLLGEWREDQIPTRVFWQISRRVIEAQGATVDDMDEYYNHIRFMRILPYQQPADAPVVGDLQRLASDTQNVHTKEVSQLTMKLSDLLLQQTVPSEQKTLQMLTIKFSKLCKIDRMSDLINVLSDMNLWYEKPTCLREGDTLYKRLLDAVVTKIEGSPHKTSLYKRAYEEARESVGLCCQGHLSRLVNIFSGFDSEFTSPVSNRELLQEKMARIAGSDSSAEDKIRQAQDILVELKIPAEEWTPWIEAI
jgi:hypothetical protein